MAIDSLQARIRKMKNPSMVCLCPTYEALPAGVKDAAREAHGETLLGAAAAYEAFCCAILDALQDVLPAVSVVSGAFSALGADGVAAMQRVLAYARQLGYYVLIDLMRADLFSAAEDMAAACFGQLAVGGQRFTPYACDGVLTTAYLGSDAIKPFTQYCKDGKNVFLIARSSNKSAREVQDLLSGDRVMHQVMADLAMRWSGDLYGRNGYSEIGLAVGATNSAVLMRLREKYDRLFFLVPGYGAQGGYAKDAAGAFDKFGHGAVVMAGRLITNAWQKHSETGDDFARCAREAAVKMREQLTSYVTVI